MTFHLSFTTTQFIYSFIQKSFIEYVLCASQFSSADDTVGNKTGKAVLHL